MPMATFVHFPYFDFIFLIFSKARNFSTSRLFLEKLLALRADGKTPKIRQEMVETELTGSSLDNAGASLNRCCLHA